eukprot:4900277-Prymnesium_polylepis.1
MAVCVASPATAAAGSAACGRYIAVASVAAGPATKAPGVMSSKGKLQPKLLGVGNDKSAVVAMEAVATVAA